MILITIDNEMYLIVNLDRSFNIETNGKNKIILQYLSRLITIIAYNLLIILQ